MNSSINLLKHLLMRISVEDNIGWGAAKHRCRHPATVRFRALSQSKSHSRPGMKELKKKEKEKIQKGPNAQQRAANWFFCLKKSTRMYRREPREVETHWAICTKTSLCRNISKRMRWGCFTVWDAGMRWGTWVERRLEDGCVPRGRRFDPVPCPRWLWSS